MLGILHFRKLTKMVGPTNAAIRVNPHGYSNRPFRLFASSISTIRVNPHGYSPWQTIHKKSKKSIIINTFMAKYLYISIIFTTFALSNKSSLI